MCHKQKNKRAYIQETEKPLQGLPNITLYNFWLHFTSLEFAWST